MHPSRAPLMLCSMLALISTACAAVADDGRADALAREAIRTTSALTTLTASITLNYNDGDQNQTLHGTLRLKKPNFAIIDLVGSPAETVASDGKDLFTLLKGANEYFKAPASPGGENISLSFALPVAFFFQPKLQGLVPGDNKPAYVGVVEKQGISYQVIQIKTEKPTASSTRFYINPQNLMTGIDAEIHMPDKTLKVSAELTDVKTESVLSDASFAFKVPDGAVMHSSSAGTQLLAIGSKAPEFTIHSASGQSISLRSVLAGKIALLINFWFCSCGPCREEFPHLQKIFDELKANGYGMLAVNGVDDGATVIKFITEKRYTFPVGLRTSESGARDSITNRYGVTSFPTNYLIGADGTVLFRSVGFDEPGLRAALRKAGVF